MFLTSQYGHDSGCVAVTFFGSSSHTECKFLSSQIDSLELNAGQNYAIRKIIMHITTLGMEGYDESWYSRRRSGWPLRGDFD